MSVLRTQILVNGVELDLLEDIPMSLSYAVKDIREPDKRNTAYSKTIRIPGTARNNKLFTSIFEIGINIQTSGTTNFDPDFNPNLKADVVVYIDTIEQFRGILKLDHIVKNGNDHNNFWWIYECTMFGRLANIFANMGDSKLQELNLSTYNHTYNKTSITNSWSTSIGSGYVYPMIDYGYNNTTTWDVSNFFPAIFLKQYIDSIFQFAGFQYQSDFFNSTYFKSLVIPFNGEKLLLSDSQILARMFRATQLTTYDEVLCTVNGNNYLSNLDTVSFSDDSTSPDFDTSDQYNPTTGVFTCENAGYYTFNSKLRFSLMLGPTSPGTSSHKISVNTVLSVNNNTSQVSGNPYVFDLSTLGTITSGTTTSEQDVYCTIANIYLQVGDTVRIKASVYNGPGNQTYPSLFSSGGGNIYYRINATSNFYNSVVNGFLTEGETLEMNSAIPREILMRDLFMSVVNAFHLCIDEDKNTPNKLIIEPYPDYITSGTTVDWTDKIDTSRPIDIAPMGALDVKRYRYTYKEDSDYHNVRYKAVYNQIYGEKFTDITNDFLKSEKRTELIFSPTPLIQIPSIDRIIPAIYTVDSNGNPTPKASNMRLLYWGGSLTTVNPWTFTSNLNGSSTVSTYPYAGHFDHPLTPTHNLNFGVEREVYYDVSQSDWYTNNNLYNRFYYQFINEISDRNSKILTAHFYLTPVDILTLNFQDKIYIDGHYYRLNKVFDYNPIVTSVTKCELLKIKNGVPFTAVQKKVYGGGDVGIGIDTYTPSYRQAGGSTGSKEQMNYNANAQRNFVTGDGNYISPTATAIIVSGSRNRVGEYCNRISVMNSSGVTVEGGVTDVTVLNSSGITVNESGVTIISNVVMKNVSGKIKRVTSAYTLSESDEMIICDGTFTVTTQKTATMLNKEYTIKSLTGTITVSGSTYDNVTPLTIPAGGTRTIIFESVANGYYIKSTA